MKLIYHFFYLINGYLFFRCLEKVFKKERNENIKGNSGGVTTSQLRSKEDGKLRDRNDEIRGFDLVFVGQNNTYFNFIFCNYWLFSKSQFSGI